MEQQTVATQGDAQQLTAMLTQMMGQINEQANEREAIRAQVRILQEDLVSLQATPSGSTSPTNPPRRTPTPQQDPIPQQAPPAQAKKKMTLPDPPRFDGNRKKYRNWRLEMRVNYVLMAASLARLATSSHTSILASGTCPSQWQPHTMRMAAQVAPTTQWNSSGT